MLRRGFKRVKRVFPCGRREKEVAVKVRTSSSAGGEEAEMMTPGSIVDTAGAASDRVCSAPIPSPVRTPSVVSLTKDDAAADNVFTPPIALPLIRTSTVLNLTEDETDDTDLVGPTPLASSSLRRTSTSFDLTDTASNHICPNPRASFPLRRSVAVADLMENDTISVQSNDSVMESFANAFGFSSHLGSPSCSSSRPHPRSVPIAKADDDDDDDDDEDAADDSSMPDLYKGASAKRSCLKAAAAVSSGEESGTDDSSAKKLHWSSELISSNAFFPGSFEALEVLADSHTDDVDSEEGDFVEEKEVPSEHPVPEAALEFPLIDHEADCTVSQSGCPTQPAADETDAATSAGTSGPLKDAAGSQETPVEQTGKTDDAVSEEEGQKDSGLLFGCLPRPKWRWLRKRRSGRVAPSTQEEE